MFFRRSFFFVFFGLLLVLGLFGLRPRTDFARGYSEGYAAAQQSSSSETGESAAETSGSEAGPTEAAQPYRHGHGWGWGYFSIFGIFGFFLKFWLMLAIFGFFMKLMGFGRHRRWHHGHWHGGDKEPREKQPEDVEPDIRHA